MVIDFLELGNELWQLGFLNLLYGFVAMAVLKAPGVYAVVVQFAVWLFPAQFVA